MTDNAIKTQKEEISALEALLVTLDPDKDFAQVQEILARLKELDPMETDVDAAWRDFRDMLRSKEVDSGVPQGNEVW